MQSGGRFVANLRERKKSRSFERWILGEKCLDSGANPILDCNVPTPASSI